jgi:hypothetical protein
MKYTFPFIVLASLLLTSCGSRDQTPSKRIVGTWECAYTNYYPNGKQTTATETEYFPDGSFTTESRIGMFITNSIAKPIIQETTVGSKGVWHIEKEVLYETPTNSSSLPAGTASKHEIVLLSGQSFTYRDQNSEVHTAIRKQ